MKDKGGFGFFRFFENRWYYNKYVSWKGMLVWGKRKRVNLDFFVVRVKY